MTDLPGGWFQPDDSGAPLRLFLLHYAGAGASVYHRWLPLLPQDFAVQCVQLPGRQERRAEPAIAQLERLVAVLHEVFDAELDDRPFALFGHSLGALLAYRLTLALQRGPGRRPTLLAVSGWSPRRFAVPAAAYATMTDDELMERVRRLDFLPAEVCADAEVLALALPAIRADLSAAGGYRDDGARVHCPVVAYCGTADPLLTPEAMAEWCSRTQDYLGCRVLRGGHMFLHDHELAIATELAGLLRRHAHAAPQS